MNNVVRTTITLPADLFEQLRTAAFHRNTNISALVREGVSRVVKYRKRASGSGIMALAGKYKIKGKKPFNFTRKDYYDEFIRRELSI